MRFDELMDLTKAPREIEPVEFDLVESEELGKEYRELKGQVHEETKGRPEADPLSDEDKEKISKDLPPCIAHILKALPKNSEKVNFNKLTMLLVTYFQAAGWSKQRIWESVKGFVENYPHSDTYNTPEKRIEHWKSEWAYLQDNPDYTFNCSFVKGLGLPGSAFDCKKCIGEKENLDHTQAEEIPDYIRQLNERHALVMVGGQAVVMNEVYDYQRRRPDITLSTVGAFNTWYANDTVEIIKNEKITHVSISKLWLSSPHRRQYERIVFDPNGTPNGVYNLWKGFAIQPKQGNWNLYQQHLWENICQEKEKLYDYILAWMADTVQNPGGERPGVSIALRGLPGVGKGVLAQGFGALFGLHFSHISSPRQLTGRFNNHLKDALVVFCDEAIWGGDKTAEGTLKAMITEDEIAIESKGKDLFYVRNRIRLIIASNNDWIVPTGLGDRRFFIVDVGEKRRRDSTYFGNLVQQMRDGGHAAMLYDLLNYTIDIDLRDIPDTEAKVDQMQRSMSPVEKFWFECLTDGQIGEDVWPEIISTPTLYNEYKDFALDLGQRHLQPPSTFIRELKKLMPWGFYRTRPIVGNERVRGYALPSLEGCREHFEKKMGCYVEWDK